ncbi:SGNH/GDSL hydrolase family protein [Shinella yambaruensis]|uniref:SGNH hydrolase-type esterase domain-containing protein n=1 Tax=Shinella yambaruensis TaxID=415996 RepID=A0ABQ5ZQG6_9HYPH|nr:SGNH/GDSL hydrolase family protein [Shinella yambaruensis]MCJ8030003.1 SGNH/GDSL hydrolase family protein [Shinella yambaruensis]MCU7984295.1 SGNH/GDSL hydrolase family protein [Shinella yambaruensis]GLR55123.1 hypothetical protein GCM10007923_63440 [Shinella yambaruensis]
MAIAPLVLNESGPSSRSKLNTVIDRANEVETARQGESTLAANLTAMKTTTSVAISEYGSSGLVVARNGTSWKLAWSGVIGVMAGNLVSVAALPTTVLAPTEGLYVDVTAPGPYSAVKAFFSSIIRADIAAGRKLNLLFNSSNGTLSGMLADNVRAAFDSKATNSGKPYPLAQRTRNGITSASPAGAWRDALLDVRVEGAIEGEVYHIGYYENGVSGSPGEGWIIQAFQASTMAGANSPINLVTRSNQQTPIVRGAGIQTIRIVPPARQDMAFVLTVNPDALPASGTAVDSSSSSANDGWSWVIDPACYTATPADPGLIAELAATANIVPNPRLAVDGTPPVLTSAAVIAAAETPLADHGIERAYEIGTGGAAFFERIGIPFDALARVAHVSAYVWSATGTDWPSLVQLHRFAGGVSQGVVNLATAEQLSANLRRLFVTTTVPAGVEDNEFRLGVPGGGLVSGARAQVGGFQGLLVSRPVSASRVPRDRWSDQYKGSNLAAALKRANPMIGKRIAIIGDSIVQNYGIPALIAERLGCEVVNLGFGGARMVWDNRTSGTLYMYKKWFSATALADAVESGDWSNQIAAAEDLYNDPGRGSTDDFRAAALLMSTMDWTKIDAILVMMGTNDYGGGIVIGDDLDTDPTHFLPATKNVIAKFSAALPKTRLLFAPPMWRGPRASHGDSNINNNGTHWMHEYQDTIIDRAAYSQIPIVPVHKEVGINVDNTLALMTDDLHPGADGAPRIVATLSGGIRRLF